MRWSYKTVHYGLKKDGLLGSVFLDDAEIEESLNEYGQGGWELVTMFETRDGVIAVFKQPLELPAARRLRSGWPKDEQPVTQDEEVAEVSVVKEWGREQERKTVPEPEPEPEIASMVQEIEDLHHEDGTYPVVDPGPRKPGKFQDDDDEEDDSASGIGAIRIE